MSWSKKEIIESAYEEIGIASYQFDIQPEMYAIALKRLDAMIASWIAQGINFDYYVPSSPNESDLEADSLIPDFGVEAAYKNLAMNIAPVFGKVVSPDLKQLAFSSFKNLLVKTPDIPQMQFANTIPAGAGNKLLRAYWTTLPTAEDRVSDDYNVVVDYN